MEPCYFVLEDAIVPVAIRKQSVTDVQLPPFLCLQTSHGGVDGFLDPIVS